MCWVEIVRFPRCFTQGGEPAASRQGLRSRQVSRRGCLTVSVRWRCRLSRLSEHFQKIGTKKKKNTKSQNIFNVQNTKKNTRSLSSQKHKSHKSTEMLPRYRPSAILFTRNLRGKFGFGGCFMESEPHQVACFAGFQWGSVFQCFMVLSFVWCSTFWVLCWKVSVKVSWRRAYEIIRALNILKHENQWILSIRNDHPASVKWTAQSGRFFLPTMETDKVNKVNKVRRFSTWIFVPQEHDPLRPSCVLPAVTSVSPGVDASRDVATASGHSLQRCRLKAGQSCNVFATDKSYRKSRIWCWDPVRPETRLKPGYPKARTWTSPWHGSSLTNDKQKVPLWTFVNLVNCGFCELCCL